MRVLQYFLTVAQEESVTRAAEILDLANRTARELAEQRDEVEGVVSVAAGEIGAVELLWRMCRTFREQYPRVRFELHTAASDVIRERLERGLAVRPLSPALYATAALAWKREQPLGRAAERFIRFASRFLGAEAPSGTRE